MRLAAGASPRDTESIGETEPPLFWLRDVRTISCAGGVKHAPASKPTFYVRAGESLMGPSGGGKTTLLTIIAGLHGRDGGEVTAGAPGVPLDPTRDIGMLSQQALLLKWRTVLDTVLLAVGIPCLAARGARTGARPAQAGRPRQKGGERSVRALRSHAAAHGDRAR
jgi:NitT/TauT family transport system ATP-binding protein